MLMSETHPVRRTRGEVERAARRTGVPARTIYRRIQKYGLTPAAAAALGKRAPYARGPQHCSMCVAVGRDGQGHDKRTCSRRFP